MKKYSFILLLTVLVFSLFNCEKDDICSESTPTTPQIVIEFYDKLLTSDAKLVNSLKVTGLNQTSSFQTFTAVSSIKIPLNPSATETSYLFNINSSSTDITNNIDIITFNYDTRNVYVSRACGYKTLFDLNPVNPFEQTNPSGDVLSWIDTIEVIQFSIENENETHIKIYF